MGNGLWSATTYTQCAATCAKTGKDAFDYSRSAVSSGILHPHQTLDPQGLIARESRDSIEHPNSTAIFISLDVTGSMDRVVRKIHQDLPNLFDLLLGQKYVSDPQILFAAVGDATCDRVPLQVGQFESDNRMDQNLENMILEGGGGGQNTESYELMLYLAARDTAADCWEKHQRKGYLFMIGDELAYQQVSADQVRKCLGGGLQADIPLNQIIQEVQEKYHFYYIIPGGAAHGADEKTFQWWQRHLGEDRVIQLDSPEHTSECIGLTIGANEGAISFDEASTRLKKQGAIGRTLDSLIRIFTALVPRAKMDPKSSRHL